VLEFRNSLPFYVLILLQVLLTFKLSTIYHILRLGDDFLPIFTSARRCS